MTINELIKLTDSIYKPCYEHNNAFVLYAFIPSIKRSMLPRSLQNLLKKNKSFYIQMLEDTQKNFPIAWSTPEPEQLKELITEAFEHIRWKAYRADYTVDFFSAAKKAIVYTGGKPEITLSPELNDFWNFIDTNGQHITNEKGVTARNGEMSPQVIDDKADLEHFKEYIRESLEGYLTGEKKTYSEIGFESVKDDTSAATPLIPQFFIMPTSRLIDRAEYVLNTNKKFEEQFFTSTYVVDTVSGKNNEYQLTFTDREVASVTVTIDDIQKAIKDDQNNASKMFNFILIAGSNEFLNWREHPTNFIQFPLQKLADIGMYKSVRTARKGFDNCMDSLENIKISAKDKRTGDFDKTRVFTRHKIIKGVCTVYLEASIDWSILTEFYTYLPKDYFALPSKSSILCYYIFYLARQNVPKDLAKRKDKSFSFIITFKSIADRLHLPKPGETKDLRGKTIEAIDKAITEIEDILKSADITLTLMYDESKTATEIYNTGKVKVVLKGIYSESFIGLSERKERIDNEIKRLEKKKERKKNAKKVT